MIREGELPEICPRPAHWTEIPTNCARLRDLAEDHGWGTEVVYTRGQGLGARVVDLVVLRLARDDTHLAVTYHDGRFNSAIRHAPRVRYNAGQVKALVEADSELAAGEAPPEVAADPREELREEYEVLGYYLTDHPLHFVNEGHYPDVVDAIFVLDKEALDEGDKVSLLGIVEDPHRKTTKRGTQMAFFGISDLSGMAPCLTFGENAERLKAGDLVYAWGEISERDEDRVFKVMKLEEVYW